MPWKPERYCLTPGCGELTPRGRCPRHAAEIEKARKERETWRDYNSPQWRAIRRKVLQLEPLCRFCGEKATVVDHIQPLKDGGTHDPANLRPLCKRCHDRRTWEDTLGRRRQKDTNEGTENAKQTETHSKEG
jgi:5-methylcytosine-specific restriction protein A